MRFPHKILIYVFCLVFSPNTFGSAIEESKDAEPAQVDGSEQPSGKMDSKPTGNKADDKAPAGQGNSNESVDLKSEPMLPMDRPDWVAAEDRLSKTVHHVSVGTELFDTKEACRAQLDEAILKAAHRYANEHLLHERAADRLSQFSLAWIREHWLVPGKEWEAVLERPSGTYHQLWVELEIFPEDQKQVLEWFQELEMLRRCVFSLVLCLGIGGIAGVLNFGLRFLKRYEKPERQS